MLKSISVQNYRGFRDKTTLMLRPLTVLLGRNSSGKSSLIRLIPLLQQSLERQSSSPILWTSDAVDLGNISDVISHSESQVELKIGIKVDAESLSRYLGRNAFNIPRAKLMDGAEIEYIVRLTADGGRTRFNGISISLEGQTLLVDWSKEGIIERFVVDGREYSAGDASYQVDTKSFFPEITRAIPRDDIARYRREPIFYDPIKDALSSIIHGRTSVEKIAYLSRGLYYVHRSIAKDALRSFPNVVAKKVTEAKASDISDLSMINDLPRIIEYLNYTISPNILGAAYIGPSRASGKRFDRLQELSVNRLDSSGDNTAMYIYSLDKREQDSFNDLMVRACGHIIKVDESGPGHVSIKIGRQGQEHFENIADVGFGFSQIVPVVAQLHAVRERDAGGDSFTSEDALFAVEQPELHLHPAMQSNLADLFVGAISTRTKNAETTTIVVETHSETFVSQIGLLIASGVVRSDQVGVYFVTKDDNTGFSEIKEVSFNDAGVIEEWPIGFFSAF